MRRYVPIADSCTATNDVLRLQMNLLDHFVGKREHHIRYRAAERFGGLEVDDQFEFGRLFDRKVSRFFTLKNPVKVNCRALRDGVKIRPLGHEPAGLWKRPVSIDRGQL